MNNKPLVVFSGPEHSAKIAESRLSRFFRFKAVPPEAHSLIPEFQKCTVFLDASMKVPIDASVIANADSLKLVITATTGATHIDANILEKRNIPLLTLKGHSEFLRGITPAAEMSWALVMACCRHLRGAISHVNQGSWERTQFPGLMLKGRSIGLIGMGRIGGWMARYAHAFDMSVSCYDPHVTVLPDYVKSMSLEEVVSNSDIVSLHVHVDESTRHMIDGKLLEQFKDGAIFINTSRSELTDEQALVNALESGQLSAVGADVVANEPEIKKSPLWRYSVDHENVVITPHIGGFCPDAVDHVVDYSCARIIEHFGFDC